MSQSVALCSEGGKFFNTTERSGFSEGEKEKNISEPVLKNEATPSSYEELKKRILDYGFKVYEEKEAATVYRKLFRKDVLHSFCEILINWGTSTGYPCMLIFRESNFYELIRTTVVSGYDIIQPEDFNHLMDRMRIPLTPFFADDDGNWTC